MLLPILKEYIIFELHYVDIYSGGSAILAMTFANQKGYEINS